GGAGRAAAAVERPSTRVPAGVDTEPARPRHKRAPNDAPRPARRRALLVGIVVVAFAAPAGALLWLRDQSGDVATGKVGSDRVASDRVAPDRVGSEPGGSEGSASQRGGSDLGSNVVGEAPPNSDGRASDGRGADGRGADGRGADGRV